MSNVTDVLRVIGVGSPFTGDTVGLEAIGLLQQETRLFPSALALEFLALDRPGSRLITHFSGAQTVVLIDAMQSGRSAATVRRLHPDELVQQAGAPSSHSLGVAEALALASALGELPQTLLLYGIEAGETVEPDEWYPPLLALLQQDLLALSESAEAVNGRT